MHIHRPATATLTFVLCLVLTWGTGDAVARPSDTYRIAQADDRGALISQREAEAIAARRSDGLVLDVQLVERDGEPVYRAKVMTPQKRVRYLFIDARRGRAR